jgi:hypothetical protein
MADLEADYDESEDEEWNLEKKRNIKSSNFCFK